MKICAKCGERNENVANYCFKCGAELEAYSEKAEVKRKPAGFRMRVIAISCAGILAVVAVSIYRLIQKANEAAEKGNLGALKSAISLYYGNNEGLYPETLDALVPVYISAIPNAKSEDGTISKRVIIEKDGRKDFNGDGRGGWWYNSGRISGRYAGDLCVNSFAKNIKDKPAGRGFSEPSRFAGMLKSNPKTAFAAGRVEPALSIIKLQSYSFEITRNSEKTLHLKLSGQPLFAHLHANVWHQGTDKKPRVLINGVDAGTLEPCWPSMAQRNYVFFLWDKNAGKTINYQADYQGWIRAHCFIDGNLLKPGKNTVTFAVKLDQIKVKNVEMEALYKFDSDDTIYDFRKKTRHLSLPKL